MFKSSGHIVFIHCVAAVLVFTSTTPSSAAERLGPSLIPATAGGFVHLHVTDLLESPALRPATKLLKRIRRELRDLSERRLGVDVTQIEEVTGIITDSAERGPKLWAFTFETRINSDAIIQRLGTQWRVQEVEGRRVFVDSATKKAVYVHSDRTVFVAGFDSLKWFFSQDLSERGPLTESIALAKGRGQVTVGLRGKIIPAELKAVVPAPFQALASARGTAFSFQLDQSLQADVQFSFADGNAVQQAEAALRNLVRLARSKLADGALEFQTGIKKQSTDFGEAVVQVFGLALVRFFDEALEQIQIRNESTRLTATIKLEESGVASLVVVGLTAIQAIGENAASSFDDVSDELNRTSPRRLNNFKSDSGQ